ncbi:MAG TPA: T9SS type A sorting domain-containing protein [Ignavibacteria bacterium]
MKWFYNQRAFPNSTVPQGSYNNGVKQYINLASSQGYLSPNENWKCIGPAPAYFGQMVSGRISSLKYNPGDASGMTIFVAGADGGVWKSLDGGATWVAKTDFISSLSSGALAIGQNSLGQYENVYYGTGESHAGFNFCYYGDGLYKSVDNGETWIKINDDHLPQNPTYFSRIVVRPGHPNEIVAACGTNHTNISYQAGLYRSTDYGQTWLNRVAPDPVLEGRICNDIVFSPNGNMAYMIGPDESSEFIWEKGVGYRISTNGGATFGAPRTDIKVNGRSHIAISSYDASRLYILTHKSSICSPGSCSPNSINAVVYVSNDGGLSFTEGAGFLSLNCNCIGGDAYQSWYDMFIYVSPQNRDIVYVGLVNLWKSTDGGQSFTAITPNHTDMQNMDLDINNANHIILGTDGGIYGSTNGGTGRVWDNLNSQLSLTQIYRIASSPFNTEIIVGGSQDNGLQSKFQNSDDWRDVLGGNDGTSVVYSKINPNLIFGGFGNYSNGLPPPIIRSNNAGVSFIPNFLPPSSVWDSQNDWIPPIASGLNRFTLIETFYTARRISTPNGILIKIFGTSDEGGSWQEIGSGINVNESPQNLAVSTSNPEVIFLSTGGYAWPYINQKLYKSTDAGISWQEKLNNTSGEVPNRYITHIEIDQADKNLVYITLSGFEALTPGMPGHIFRSTNGGNNWADLSGYLPDIPVNDLVIVYNDTKNFIIGTDVGVLGTTNGGGTWNEIGPGLPHVVVTDLEYNPLSGRVRAATFGRGVWEFLLVAASVNIDHIVYLNGDANGLKIDHDIIIEKGGKLVIPYSCKILMGEGKKIIIKNGAEIDVTAAVTFTSQKGNWGGIEIRGNALGRIKNCIFNYTETPIVFSQTDRNSTGVTISNCSFNGGNITARTSDIFSLSQNYPNPFNPVTIINYSIPNVGTRHGVLVQLKIYDALGRLVETLVNETKNAGYYNVTFDGSNISSGNYFYTIEAGDYKASKKMVLIK